MERRDPFDAATLAEAAHIVSDVRDHGETALRRHAARLDGLGADEPLVLPRDELESARAMIPREVCDALSRCAARIRRFAEAQRACLNDLTLEIPGGSAGHTIQPLGVAGCYAPGGRFPLVSSMLMTVVTARAAGVEQVWAASPNPSVEMCATAAIAGADALLACGGAHAIAALAYGVGAPPRCDVIVGPGNRWVTVAKHLVSSTVRIDMLAGPSELLILADDSAGARLVAADLLAQAEHDPDARPMLVTTCESLIAGVNVQLLRQLATLPTRAIAAEALGGGFAVVARDLDEAIVLCERIAPEHVELHVKDADAVATRIRCCGCVFIGSQTTEAFGDYGAGPNHTLPTGGTARFVSGLSVSSFLRRQTWLRHDPGSPVPSDYAALARIEGLEAHARSAELRNAAGETRTR